MKLKLLLITIAMATSLKAKDIEISISDEGLITSIREITIDKNKKKIVKIEWNLKNENNLPFYELFINRNYENGDKACKWFLTPADPSMMKFILNEYLKKKTNADDIYNKLVSKDYIKTNEKTKEVKSKKPPQKSKK